MLKRSLLASLLAASSAAQDLVLVGGHVWTGDPERPTATAVLVCGDRIARIGDDAAVVAAAVPDARRIELAGRRVLPGIIDAHVHFLGGGDELLAPDLRSATSEEDFARRLAAAAAGLPAGTWLTSPAELIKFVQLAREKLRRT